MKSLNRIGLALLFFVQLSLSGFAQSGIINTVAGNGTQGFGGDGGLATSAGLAYAYGIAVDTAGNLFIADSADYRIRKVTPGGVISTVAGNGGFGLTGDGGQATSAQFRWPYSIAVDAAGNLFIADTNNFSIRKVTPDGVINTVAGNTIQGFSGDGGLATSAQLNHVYGIAVDTAGNLFIADYNNNRVRKVTPGGVISTVAGNGTQGFSGDGGQATSAQLFQPSGVAVDAAGDLFIVDYGNSRVRKVTPSGVISTVAGNGTPGFSGDGGWATSAQLNYPWSVAVDTAGNVFIADANNNRIRKVTPGGAISTVAGNGSSGFKGDGGPATSAQLAGPSGVAVDTAGNLFIADTDNFRVREVTGQATVSTFFPQVAVGGGYSTLFTITNTGSTSASASLVLTDQHGNPFLVNGMLTDSSGTTQPSVTGYSFPLTVPAGGTIFLSAAAGGPVTAGWAQLDSTGGSLTAVATYEYVVGTVMQTMVGVMQSQPLQYATISVDNNSSQNKQTEYAIANPSSQSIAIKLALVGQNGTVIDDTVTLTILPGQQIADYLWQDLGRKTFKGSLVLRGQAGATFVVVALVDKQGFTTVIPLVSGKAPGVPN